MPVAGFVANSLDCDDTTAQRSPSTAEVGYNFIDDDCDGQTDEGFAPKIPTTFTGACGGVLPAINSYIYCNIIAGVSGYRWKVTTLSGPNSGLIQYVNTTLRCVRLTQLPIYSFNTTYKIQAAVFVNGVLQPFSTTSCTVTTPITLPFLEQCASTVNSFTQPIFATLIPLTTAYRFKITDPVNPVHSQEIVRQLREFRLLNVTAFELKYNKTYQVEVAVRYQDGQWSPYGPACTITTPVFPTVRIREEYCSDADGGPFVPNSMSDQIWADAFPGVIAYVFKLVGPGLPAAGQEFATPARWTTLAYFQGLIPGATYNISVRIVFSNAAPAGPYGKICTVKVPGPQQRIAHAKQMRLSPNPFTNGFHIESNSVQPVEVRINDSRGRELYRRTYTAEELARAKLGSDLPTGLYTVTLGNAEVHKMIKL